MRTTWAPAGRPPVIRRVSKRREVSSVIAVTPSGRIAARHVIGTVKGPDVIRALQHFRRVLGRLNPSYEEAAYDLGASKWQTVRGVVLPIVFPGIIAVALFGFTLSYDEFPRSWLTVGSKNTLPLEIWTMTTNVTSPALYALGTVTTVVSFVVIAVALSSILIIQRRRSR